MKRWLSSFLGILLFLAMMTLLDAAADKADDMLWTAPPPGPDPAAGEEDAWPDEWSSPEPRGDAAASGEEAFHEIEDELIEQALLEQGYYREDVPLDYSRQDYLHTACDTYGVPYEIALAVIEIESGFQLDARNGSHVGLFQLSAKYFPGAESMTPMEEIFAGVEFLSRQMDRYGLEGGIQAYHDGHDTGARGYARKVLAAAEEWK